MPIWQVQIKEIAVWSTPHRDMFQQKIDKILNNLPNVCGILDHILVVGYEYDGKDHDDTLQKVIQGGKLKIKQR